MTLSKKGLFVTHSMNDTQHYGTAESCYAESRFLYCYAECHPESRYAECRGACYATEFIAANYSHKSFYTTAPSTQLNTSFSVITNCTG